MIHAGDLDAPAFRRRCGAGPPPAMIPRLVLASNNAGKLREFAALLSPLSIEVVPQAELGIPEADEPHVTFVENALAKARHASALAGTAGAGRRFRHLRAMRSAARRACRARATPASRSPMRRNNERLRRRAAGRGRPPRALRLPRWCWCATPTIPSRSIAEGDWHGTHRRRAARRRRLRLRPAFPRRGDRPHRGGAAAGTEERAVAPRSRAARAAQCWMWPRARGRETRARIRPGRCAPIAAGASPRRPAVADGRPAPARGHGHAALHRAAAAVAVRPHSVVRAQVPLLRLQLARGARRRPGGTPTSTRCWRDLEFALPSIWGRRVRHGVLRRRHAEPVLRGRDRPAARRHPRPRLPLAPDAEITLEANPGTFERERFAGFRGGRRQPAVARHPELRRAAARGARPHPRRGRGARARPPRRWRSSATSISI